MKKKKRNGGQKGFRAQKSHGVLLSFSVEHPPIYLVTEVFCECREKKSVAFFHHPSSTGRLQLWAQQEHP